MTFSAPPADPAALEKKLVGQWSGSIPCSGDLEIQADGTSKLAKYGPGAVYRIQRTWKMRWDALPSALVLTWKTSDRPKEVGQSTDVKVLRLNDSELKIQYSKADGNPDWETAYQRPASKSPRVD